MHELGGNIRVFVPTHPFLPGDGAEHESLIEVCPDGESIVDDPCGGGNHSFTFDEVFPPSSGQDLVSNEIALFMPCRICPVGWDK
jgi:hypothetical protein